MDNIKVKGLSLKEFFNLGYILIWMPKWPVRPDTKVTVNTYTYTNTLTISYIPKWLNLLALYKPKAPLTRIQNMLYSRTRIYALHSHQHSQNTKITVCKCELGEDMEILYVYQCGQLHVRWDQRHASDQWLLSALVVHILTWLVMGPMMFQLQRGKERAQHWPVLGTYKDGRIPSIILDPLKEKNNNNPGPNTLAEKSVYKENTQLRAF